ncbi:MAG TPA: hypothetical protein VJV78_29315 [Polyangiales bacterium]|nr:hypothetical protein [Polyangiales bacterium]
MFEVSSRSTALALAAVGCGVLFGACQPKCLTADTVSVVDSKRDVFLVYRVTGLQEKVGFFEAYRGKPTFDQCGKSSAKYLDMQPYEPSEGLLKAVELSGDHLKVVYTPDRSEARQPDAARLVIRSP